MLLTTLALSLGSAVTRADGKADDKLEEIFVWGQSQDRTGAGYTSPTSLLQQRDLVSINVATTEDVVKYEPSLVIRRRFIGDSNGVMGIRGSNMFQTSRSMVFADGVPLRYLLQSRWDGAPRWTLVSASEIAQVETVYGPFSAEYSGNSIGGVVLIETAIPQQRECHFVLTYDNTGWRNAEVKLNIDNVGATGMSVVTGLRFETYELNFDVYASNNWNAGSQDTPTDSSGGKTEVSAAFVQLNWDVSERWDASLGGRYESFESREGYFANNVEATPGLDLTATPGTSRDQFSPKFSLGYRPAGDNWQLRYSFGRAYRFPIVEELFSQFSAFNAESIPNPELKPEDATAHNFMIDRNIAEGYLRLNVFSETVEDVIESQSTTLPGGISIRTFVPIDKVKTEGVEFIVNQRGMFIDQLDVRFNVAYTDSEILNNNADPSIEGNRYPRMPKWRANLLATYNITPRWDVGANLQYASDSFGRTDNTDTANRVYGAQDGYTRIGLKTGWRVNKAFGLGLGVDNLSNEISYVAHPWPGRTWYGSISYDL